MSLTIGSDIISTTNALQSLPVETITESVTQSIMTSILNKMYPVDSLYISVNSTNPSETLGIGSWEQVSSGRVLQGVGTSQTAGTNVEAGLPNHTHFMAVYDAGGVSDGGGYVPANSCIAGSVIVNTGTKSAGDAGTFTDRGSTTYCTERTQMSYSSASNSIYGNSSTVQPPAYLVYIWRRIS